MVDYTRNVSIPGAPAGGRTRTEAIPAPRTFRRLDLRTLTSFPAGKFAPIAAWPLLREDRLSASRMRLSFEMLETAELVVNAITVRVMAYLVPNLAFQRFNGIDQLNRSYMKEPETDGGTVTPFIKTRTMEAHGLNPILKTMGKHAREGQIINDAYIEAYNTVWNFRVRNRSPDIPLRLLNDNTLAKAFWNHQQFAHIVPDFDQASIEGEVPLTVVDGNLPVVGLALKSGQPTINTAANGWLSTKGVVPTGVPITQAGEALTGPAIGIQMTAAGTGGPANLPKVFAELAEQGITVSLANIELARKTQAFARLRRLYSGHTDDYIIDLLMNAVSVPEQAWRQPILLADRSTVIGMAKRYASDSLDLTASVANGAAFVDLMLTTPRVPVGGVIMIFAEITPEQLWERQEDPYMTITDQENYPEFLRDTLDPEKVEIVQNQYVDMAHATPTGVFGYAPLNHKWNHVGPCVGGKFYRPATDAPTDEDRQRIWACETLNPTLSEDFYLATSIHQKPFVVTNVDPFECVLRGVVQMEGNTVFGDLLLEASDDYNQVLSEAPIDVIDKASALETEEE